jgi:hypothetical protein
MHKTKRTVPSLLVCFQATPDNNTKMSYFDYAKDRNTHLISKALEYRSYAVENKNKIDSLRGKLRNTRHPQKRESLSNQIRFFRKMRSEQLEIANEAEQERQSFVTTIGSL